MRTKAAKTTLGLCGALLIAVCAKAETAAFTPVVLEGPQSHLTVGTAGFSLKTEAAGCPSSEATGEPFWAVLLEPAPGSAVEGDGVLDSKNQPAPEVEKVPGGVKVTYGALTDGKTAFDIALTLTVRSTGDAFEIGGEIRNGTKDWVVKGVVGPVFNGIRTELEKTPLLLPNGLGWRINRVPADGQKAKPWTGSGERLTLAMDYPSRTCTMAWLAFASETNGLYFGSHDPRFGAKTLTVRYDPGRKTFSALFHHRIFVRPGVSGAVPTLIVKPYTGDWHAAARTYRAWVDSLEKQIEKPAWAKTASGWLLAILKQQNGDIMWPYDTLDELAKVADDRGLDILGLFGWGYGGHDHLYPDYNPCPIMGGEKGLREGIKQAHARDKRVVLYANGQLLERGTAYWTTTGQYLAVTRQDGSTVQEFWHKYGNTPGYHFDIGCHATEGWQERMLALAVQACDFGADGILFDQLGVRGPTPCYAANHGHPVPFMSYEADRKEMLRQIAVKMKAINPDFVVMTEGFHDAVLDSVCYFHGCVRGTFQQSAGEIAQRFASGRTDDLFPEMVRYTYPEMESTIRFPSPLVDRPMANYTITFGLRYEIESRYVPDRDYLMDGRIPEIEDYGTVLSKPNIDLMRTLPIQETADYLKRVATFQKKHADLLMTGTFTDTEGFTFSGQGVVAKGYRAGDAFGVILWNTTDKPAAITVDVPGFELALASEPETDKVEPFSELAPQTVRLLVWQRK